MSATRIRLRHSLSLLNTSLLEPYDRADASLPSTPYNYSIAMEPLSAAASIVGVIDVALRTTTALYAYLKDVKNAASNKSLLAEEVSSLLRVLEILHTRAKKNQHQNWSHQQKDLISAMGRACEDLIKILKFDVATGKLRQEGRLKTLQDSTMWSFNKSEVYSILERIARLQQYANTLLLDDQRY